MPNSRFSEREDRQIGHIKKSALRRGLSEDEAEHRAFGAVVNQKKRALRRMAEMKGRHCHKNGTCHDHPDDGKDYG